MIYDRETWGIGREEKRLGEGNARRDEVEEEPSELDVPAADAFADDDLEDETIEIVAIEGEDEEEEEGAADRTRLLAEDAPPAAARMRKAKVNESESGESTVAVESESDDDLDEGPGVRTSGGTEIGAMSQSERRREFPSVRAGGAKRRDGSKGPSRSRKRPSSTPARRPG